MRRGSIPLIVFCLLLVAAEARPAGNAVSGMAKSAPCVGCHGADASSGHLTSPSLAGQQSAYLVVQMKAYREKSRLDAVMNKVAADLTDADIDDLAAYYASRKPLVDATRHTKPRWVARGKKKYGVCKSCHGPKAAGRQENPRLAGMQPDYTFRQLLAFQEGKRKNPANPIMNSVAANLSRDDMKALAEYLASLK